MLLESADFALSPNVIRNCLGPKVRPGFFQEGDFLSEMESLVSCSSVRYSLYINLGVLGY